MSAPTIPNLLPTSIRLSPHAALAGLSAVAISSSQIKLTWAGSKAAVGTLRVFQKAVGRRWYIVSSGPATVSQYIVSRLASSTHYYFRLQAIPPTGRPVYSDTVSAITPVAPAPPGNIVYSGPIVITQGGVYSGNWQSLDPNTPAVQIETSDPVVIQNSHIRSRSSCISTLGNAANITVRNTYGYGLNPNVVGQYPGRFMDIDGFTNITAYNNYMEGTSGIYLYNYLGDHSVSQTVHISRNVARNIDGRFSDGNGGFQTQPDANYFVQFFQINGVHDLAGAEVAWNQVINDPGKSRVEENINIFDSSGTAQSPFLIHDNYIQGAYPADPLHNTTYSGGGIMLSDQGGAWIRAFNNQVLDTSNEGIIITSGHDNAFYNNRIVSSGLLPDGTPNPSQNVGAAIFNFNNEVTFKNNSGWNNVIGWVRDGERNDAFVPDATTWANNTSMADPITQATEANEWTIWQNKLAATNTTIGSQNAA